MGEGYNFQQLEAETLALSRITDWKVAKQKWKLLAISLMVESGEKIEWLQGGRRKV